MATEILGIPELSATQSNKFLTVNSNNRQIEVFLTGVLDRDAGAVPVSPSNGDAYIVDVVTGAWGAFTLGDVAHYYGGTWYNYTPAEGSRLWVADEDITVVWDGSAWVNEASSSIGVAGLTDDSVPFVSSGLLTEDINFNYDPGTDTLSTPSLTVTNTATASVFAAGSNITIAGNDVLDTTDIGVSVQAYDADTTKNDVSNTFTAAQIFPAGSASLPSITTTGDLNTGIFFPAADTIGVATNGSEGLRIDSSGNVLIGGTSGSNKLEVTVPASTGLGRTDVAIVIPDTAGNRGGLGVLSTSGVTIGGLAAEIVTAGAYPNAFGRVDLFVQNGASTTTALTADAAGNILIGGTTAGTSSASTLHLFNGTAPTGSVTNGVILYSEDVSSSAELKVRDEAGNVTTLSPHNFSLIPEGPSEDMAWAYYSEKDGKRINIDMLKAIRMLEKLTGEKLVYED